MIARIRALLRRTPPSPPEPERYWKKTGRTKYEPVKATSELRIERKVEEEVDFNSGETRYVYDPYFEEFRMVNLISGETMREWYEDRRPLDAWAY